MIINKENSRLNIENFKFANLVWERCLGKLSVTLNKQECSRLLVSPMRVRYMLYPKMYNNIMNYDISKDFMTRLV
jgi:hypothetical protein